MLRRIVLGMIAVLVLVVAIVLVRTLIFTSIQLEPQAATPLAVDADAAIQRLAKSLTFKTISHQIPWGFRWHGVYGLACLSGGGVSQSSGQPQA